MEDDNLGNQAAEFGELFEGEGVFDDSTFSEADVLGLQNGLDVMEAEDEGGGGGVMMMTEDEDEEEVVTTTTSTSSITIPVSSAYLSAVSSSSDDPLGVDAEEEHNDFGGGSDMISSDISDPAAHLHNPPAYGEAGLGQLPGTLTTTTVMSPLSSDIKLFASPAVTSFQEEDSKAALLPLKRKFSGIIESSGNVKMQLLDSDDGTIKYIMAGETAATNEADGDYNSDDDDDDIDSEDTYYLGSDAPKEKINITKNLDFIVRIKMNKYLKRRGYRETLLPKTINVETLQEYSDFAASMSNTPYWSSCHINEIQDEMDRFFKFYQSLKSKNAKHSCEISKILMPILLFFVRESYSQNYLKPVTNKLVSEFVKIILQEDRTPENCLIAVALCAVKSESGFQDTYLKQVSERKRKIELSDWTFRQLTRFLSKSRTTVLLKILSDHFQVDVIPEEMSQEETQFNEVSQSAEDEEFELDSKEQEILDRLRSSVAANLPSVKVYTTNGMIASAAISLGASTVAFGMSTAGIRICSVDTALPLIEDEDSISSEDTELDSAPPDSPSPVTTVCGHSGGVYGLCFHPKTKLLFSAGEDKMIRVWELQSPGAACKAVYRGHYGPIWSMGISSSGHMFGTASMDTSARLWLPERVDCVRILAGHYSDVECIKFHPNDSYVATGSLDRTARLWSVNEGNMVRLFTGAERKISALSFHQSGNYLIGGGDHNLLQVWDIREGELIAELPCIKQCKDLSIHHNMVAGCFANGTVQIWNLRNIVGGDDLHLCEDFEGFAVPRPFSFQSEASALVSLYYKDRDSLLGLGSVVYPPLPEDPRTIPEVEVVQTYSNNVTNRKGIDLTEFIKEIPISHNSDNICDSILSENMTTTNEIDDVLTSRIITNPPPMEISPAPLSLDDMSSRMETIMPSVDIEDCLGDMDIENADTTITSSDIDFDVDEQILESLVDSTLLQPSSS